MSRLDRFLAEPIASRRGQERFDTALPWDAALESLCAGLPLEGAKPSGGACGDPGI